MTALLAGFLTNPTILAIIAGIVAALGWGWKRERVGAAKERAKQAKARQRTIEDLHEMDREATDAERKARDLSDEEAKKEALKWRKS